MEVEQLELELALTWNAGISGGNLAYATTMFSGPFAQ